MNEWLEGILSVGGLTGIGVGIKALADWRRDRYKPRIEVGAAAITGAETASAIALKIAEKADEKYDKLQKQYDVLRAEFDEMKSQLNEAIYDKGRWKRWATDVYDNWNTYRQNETPPPLPQKKLAAPQAPENLGGFSIP